MAKIDTLATQLSKNDIIDGSSSMFVTRMKTKRFGKDNLAVISVLDDDDNEEEDDVVVMTRFTRHHFSSKS